MGLSKGVPEILKKLLNDKNITKVAHSFDRCDIKKLSGVGLTVSPIVDVEVVAREVGFKRTSLKHLVYNLFGYDIDKRTALSDWSQYPLSDEQIHYAAEDAYFHLIVYEELKKIYNNDERVLDPPSRDNWHSKPVRTQLQWCIIHDSNIYQGDAEVENLYIIPSEVHAFIKKKDSTIARLQDKIKYLEIRLNKYECDA